METEQDKERREHIHEEMRKAKEAWERLRRKWEIENERKE